MHIRIIVNKDIHVHSYNKGMYVNVHTGEVYHTLKASR